MGDYMLLSLYFFVIGWVSVLSPHAWISFPLAIILLSIVINFIYIREGVLRVGNSKVIYSISLLFYFFVFLIVLSLFIQQFSHGYDILGFVHSMRYLSVIVLFYFTLLFLIEGKKMSMNSIYKYISWGVFFVSSFTILEFFAKNLLQFDFDAIFPRATVSEFEATYAIMGERFIRARGTTEESGHLALYLAMFLPFAYYYFEKYKIAYRFMLIGVIVFALLLTFSAMGFVELIILTTLLLIFSLYSNGNKKIFILLGSLVMIVALISISIYKEIDYYSLFGGIFSKITLENATFSYDGSRTQRWLNAFELIREKPFFGHGSGIASILYGTGSTSFYLEILVEFGIIGLMTFFFITLLHLILVFRLQSKIKYVYLTSLIIALLHYSIISNYWYPWLWTIFVLIVIEFLREQKEINSVEERKY